jgi:GNAT superfamily N-acetyltransferase
MRGWRVEPDVDDARAYALLGQDPGWSGYAIADLEPPFRAYSRVAVARQRDAEPAAACLVLRHPDIAAIVPCGDAAGVAAILDAVELPERTFVSVRREFLPALKRHYTFPAGLLEMRRMRLTAATFTPPAGAASVECLGPSDLTALLDLYAAYAESAFVPDHLRNGIFYGVRTGAGLAAAGGTHVISTRYRVAAVGNIYTRPAARGHGYATAITAAVVRDLLALPCDDLILNVAATNHTAAAIYRRLGFRDHCPFWEGRAERVKHDAQPAKCETRS